MDVSKYGDENTCVGSSESNEEFTPAPKPKKKRNPRRKNIFPRCMDFNRDYWPNYVPFVSRKSSLQHVVLNEDSSPLSTLERKIESETSVTSKLSFERIVAFGRRAKLSLSSFGRCLHRKDDDDYVYGETARPRLQLFTLTSVANDIGDVSSQAMFLFLCFPTFFSFFAIVRLN